MADFNDDIEAFREALRKTREVTEEDILAREGYARNQNGILGKIESASKRRADTEEKIYKQIEAAFGKEQALAGKRLRAQEKQQDLYEKQVEGMGYTIKSNGEFVKSTIELTKEQKKTLATLKDANEKAEKMAKAAENPGKAFSELSNRFKDSKAIVGEFSNQMLDSVKHSKTLTATYQLVGASLEGLTKATMSMAKSLYAGERGATVSAKAFGELTESIGSMMQGIGAAVTVLSIFTPIGRLLKLAAVGLTALGAGIKLYGEYQKLGAEQNKKLFDSYNKLSASGLAASNGLTSVFETVQTLGMTASEIERFTEILVNNSKELKLFGSTAADGAKKYTEVAGALVKSDIGQKLEMMGVTADEQREHTLRYMANQTRMGMMQGKTQQELIRGSQVYIEELDKISMMTGATRKEQEEARAAVMAEENLRAAMLQAEVDGDKERQKQLKAIADYSTYLRASGDTRGATGVANYGAMGGPSDDASAAAMITYGKGIEAALNGKPIAEVIKEGQKSADQTLKQMAGTRAVGGDVSGLVTGKYGNLLDTSKMNAELLKAVGPNGDINDYLTQLQKQRVKADDKLNATVEGNRLQQDAAMKMDSVVFSKFNHAAELHRISSDIFNKAVTTFSETVGAKPVTGGGYSTGGGGGGAAPAAPSAAAPMSSTGGGAATGNPNLTRQSLRSRSAGAPPTPGSDDTHATGGGGGNNIKLSSISSKSGKSTQVGAAYASQFQQLVDYLDTTGYEIRSLGGYIDRDVRGKPGQKSVHAHGGAIDINPDTNPMGGTLVTDMPGDISSVAQRLGLGWGGNWNTRKDAMHFSAAMSEGGTLLKARNGGIFNGPTSGYDVQLHGREAIVPLPDPNSIISVNEGVKKESVTSAMSNLGSNTGNPADSPSAILQELLVLMEDKFDSMIDKLSTGNDISDKLLRNSLV